jgi:thiazole biosynthesis enzyme
MRLGREKVMPHPMGAAFFLVFSMRITEVRIMKLDDVTISRLIVESYTEKLTSILDVDVAMVGAGPANMTAGYFLGKAGLRSVIFESKLAPGGGMWGGGMMLNEAVIQEDASGVAEELGIRIQPRGLGYYTFDSVEAASCLSYRCIQAGTRIMNCVRVEDVMFREEAGVKRVCGLVINWSPVKSLDLHVDPLSVRSAYVVDGTGHPAEITTLITQKMGVRLNNATGQVVGELPLWAHEGEQFTVVNTNEVYPGLFVTGMAANNAYGGPRMGPIFGGMLLSGKKAAEMIIERCPRQG